MVLMMMTANSFVMQAHSKSESVGESDAGKLGLLYFQRLLRVEMCEDGALQVVYKFKLATRAGDISDFM